MCKKKKAGARFLQNWPFRKNSKQTPIWAPFSEVKLMKNREKLSLAFVRVFLQARARDFKLYHQEMSARCHKRAVFLNGDPCSDPEKEKKRQIGLRIRELQKNAILKLF